MREQIPQLTEEQNMITKDERLPIRSTKDLRDELHKGGSVSYMAVTKEDGSGVQYWRVRCTSVDGHHFRIISASQSVTDRIFKELSSLYTFHHKLFLDDPNQELHLPLVLGQWSREHSFAISAGEQAANR